MTDKQKVALRGIREFAVIIRGQVKARECTETLYSADLASGIEKRVDFIEQEERSQLTPADIAALQADNKRLQADNATLEKAAAGYCEAMNEAQSENKRLQGELEGYRQAEREGRMVRLPGELVAPYELNARYWVCGWNLEDCTLIIQDRMLKQESARAALK
jgi:ABC-type phosphate transport system auxiliary subunit